MQYFFVCLVLITDKKKIHETVSDQKLSGLQKMLNGGKIN
jgi:hypothetical protein